MIAGVYCNRVPGSCVFSGWMLMLESMLMLTSMLTSMLMLMVMLVMRVRVNKESSQNVLSSQQSCPEPQLVTFGAQRGTTTTTTAWQGVGLTTIWCSGNSRRWWLDDAAKLRQSRQHVGLTTMRLTRQCDVYRYD